MKTPKRNKVAVSVRRQNANKRMANGRTPAAQLAELDKRLGVGVGATKERARLAKLLAVKHPVQGSLVEGDTTILLAPAKPNKASRKKGTK